MSFGDLAGLKRALPSLAMDQGLVSCRSVGSGVSSSGWMACFRVRR